MDSTEQKIGDYLLTEPLGDDEIGHLYLAEHAETGEPCVVNVLHEEFAEDRRFGERFRSVARTVRDLTHGRIVGVREMRRVEGRYFVAMDYVAGPRGKPMSLKDYLAYRTEQADGTVQDKLVRIWSIQIGEALAFAHNHGQRHNALSPEKVLIDAANNIKVAGFGLASAVGEQFLFARILHNTQVHLAEALSRPRAPYTGGDPSVFDYLAPEQRHVAQVDERADIYAFGVMLYRMLTGVAPSNFTAPPSDLSDDISPQWDEVVMTCLAEYPTDRYHSAEELLEALKGVGETRVQAGGAASPEAPAEQQADLDAELAAAAAASAEATVSRGAGMPKFRRQPAPQGGGRFAKALMVVILLAFGAAIALGLQYYDEIFAKPYDQPAGTRTSAKDNDNGGGDEGGSGNNVPVPPRGKGPDNGTSGGPNGKPATGGNTKPPAGVRSPSILATLRAQAEGIATTAKTTDRMIDVPKPPTAQGSAVERMKRLSAISGKNTVNDIARAFMDPSRRRRTTTNTQARLAFYKGKAARESAEKIAQYTTAVELDPDYAWAYVQRGFVHFFDRQYLKALADYTEAIKLDSDDYVPYYCRALTFEKLGKDREAKHDYDRAEQRAPKSTAWHIHAGNDYAMKGQYPEAIVQYTKAIALDPKNALAYNNRGVAHGDSGKHAEAVADLTKAIELDDSNFQSYFARGLAHLRLGKYDQAIADNTSALAINPSSPRALYNRGYAYEKKGNFDEAKRNYEDAKEIVAPRTGGKRLFD